MINEYEGKDNDNNNNNVALHPRHARFTLNTHVVGLIDQGSHVLQSWLVFTDGCIDVFQVNPGYLVLWILLLPIGGTPMDGNRYPFQSTSS